MDASPLAKLPPELRSIIYELVLYRPLGFRFERRRKNADITYCNPPDQRQRHMLALTEVCKHVRAESTSTFYAINSFIITPWVYRLGGQWNIFQASKYNRDMKAYKRWLKKIGHDSAAAIRFFFIISGTWQLPHLGKASGRWWKKAREIEYKMLHGASLPLNASFAFVRVQLDSWTFHACHDPYLQPECHSSCFRKRCSEKLDSMSFSLPTNDKAGARISVEQSIRAKGEHLEAHVEHEHCWMAVHLQELLAGLQIARNTLLTAIGD